MKSHSGRRTAQLSLRPALPTRVSPFETQCPAYPPKAPLTRPASAPPVKENSALPTSLAPAGGVWATWLMEMTHRQPPFPPPLPLNLSLLPKFETCCVRNSSLHLNKALISSRMSFICYRCVMVVCAAPPWVVWGLFIYAFQALFSSSFWG